MNRKEAAERLLAHRREIRELEKKMREVRAQMPSEEATNYEFHTARGAARLSDLFGSHRDLVVVHSMGMHCAYCTLWADGYNGIYEHLVSRAAFVIAAPDEPAELERVKAERGWRFPLVSHRGNSFASDMGFRADDGRLLPGLSTFQREGSRVLHVSDAAAAPGDAFCSLYHIFDLLPDGLAGFRPQRSYG